MKNPIINWPSFIMGMIIATLLFILFLFVAGPAGAEEINSRIEFFDGDKWVVIDIEPNKVYRIGSKTGYYGNTFKVLPGEHVWEYPNDSNCISDPRKHGGISGTSFFVGGEHNCTPKQYGKED